MNIAFSTAIHGWSSAKDRLEGLVPIDNVFLHVLAGVAIYWMATRVLAGRRGPLFAWLLVLAAIVANELVDLLVERWPNFWDQLLEGAADIVWTLALPTVSLILSRPAPLPQERDAECSSFSA